MLATSAATGITATKPVIKVSIATGIDVKSDIKSP